MNMSGIGRGMPQYITVPAVATGGEVEYREWQGSMPSPPPVQTPPRGVKSPSPSPLVRQRPYGFGRGLLALKISESLEHYPGRLMPPGSPSPVTPPFPSPPFVTPVNMSESLRQTPSPPSLTDTLTDTCTFCQRPTSNIVCRSCGHTFVGRVQAKCNQHPGVIHLMDFQCCPNCKASHLQEFTSPTLLERH